MYCSFIHVLRRKYFLALSDILARVARISGTLSPDFRLNNFSTFISAGYGQFSVSLSMHQSNAFNSVVNSFPAAVTLGARVYFEAAIGSNDSNIVALIEKCSASPTTNKNHASSYSLITNRLKMCSYMLFLSMSTFSTTEASFSCFCRVVLFAK